MAWVDTKTIAFGADTVIRQRGDQTTGFLGHRISINGTPGTAYPLAEVAINGAYRASDAVFNLKNAFLPELFEAAETAGSSYPAGPATVTCTAGNLVGFSTSFAVGDGTGEMHSWAWANNAGAGGDNAFIDSGGGPTDDDVATRIETRINALAIAGLIVARLNNVLTISSANGVKAFSGDAGVVVT